MWFVRSDYMMASSNGNIFRVTGPLCGEFTGPGEFPTQRPVTRSIDVFFDLRLNKRLSKRSWGWWFETASWSLWRHCNEFRLDPWNLYQVNQELCSKVILKSTLTSFRPRCITVYCKIKIFFLIVTYMQQYTLIKNGASTGKINW